MRRAALVGAAALALALLGALLLWRWTPEAAPAAARLHFEPGAMHGYRLSLATGIRMRVGDEPPRQLDQSLSGTLHMRVFEVGREDVRLGFQLDPVRYLVEGRQDPAVEERLSTPFFARFSLRGAPLSFSVPAGLPETEAILLEEIVRTFQVTLGDMGAQDWEATETNAMGAYRALYHRAADNRLLKQKTGFTALASNFGLPGRAPTVELLTSRAEFALDPRAWLREAAVEETLHVDTQGLESWTHTQGTLELIDVDGDDEVALFQGRDAEAVRLAARPEPRDEPRTPTPHASRASQDRALEKMLERWRLDDPSRVARLRDLLAALNADEGMVAAIEDRVREGGIDGDESAMLIHALERHGSAGAQLALVSLMEDRSLNDANRLRAVIALGGVEVVTDDAVDALLDVSRDRGQGGFDTDLANTALLSLGSAAYGLRELDAQRSAQVAEMLETSLHRAGSENETGMAIKALSNTNDPERAHTVAPYLDSPSEFVRSSAARAYGQLQGEGASDALSARLASEPSARVRVALAAGLVEVEQASPTSIGLVAQHVRSEPQAEARQEMARYLGAHLDAGDAAGAEAEAALKALAIGDASEAVRRQAAATLYARQSEARAAQTASR